MKHHVELDSIRFSEQMQGSPSAPNRIVVMARCACGLEYQITAESMVEASEALQTAVRGHLTEMQERGEQTDPWPFYP